jgi:hypothetical protein
MKPEAQIKTATKELVDSLLSMNTSNRGVRKTIVNSYTRDIKAGKWKLTNQGIGVTVNGVLADGQHRLLAIRECGYPPIPMLIVTGLDPDIQIAVDAHAKRSARDLLQFAFGARVSRSAPAIANVLIRVDKGWGSGGATNHELMDKINDFSEEIETIMILPNNEKVFAAPYLAAFCVAMKENPQNLDKIRLFIERVESGELLTKKMPEFHFRNFMSIAKHSAGSATAQKERYLKASKALAASIEEQEMGVLRI